MGFFSDLKKEYNDLTADPVTGKNISTKGKPKINIEILRGHEQLGVKKKLFQSFQLFQLDPGEAKLKIDGAWTDKEYYFIKYERTENIKKSALDVAGWTFGGSMLWGKTGALAGGLAAQQGKDNSTAALFLVEKDTGQKVMLIIKCDSKVLSKLSLFIPIEEDEIKTEAIPDKYEQLDKIARLKEQGILTDEEFQVEKEKILNL